MRGEGDTENVEEERKCPAWSARGNQFLFSTWWRPVFPACLLGLLPPNLPTQHVLRGPSAAGHVKRVSGMAPDRQPPETRCTSNHTRGFLIQPVRIRIGK